MNRRIWLIPLILLATLLVTQSVTASSTEWRLPFVGNYTVSEACYKPDTNPMHIDSNYSGAVWALDVPMQAGTPIFASTSGQVVFSGWDDSGYGWLIRIRDGGGYEHWLAHLSKRYVFGGNVGKGDLIGLSGNSGTGSYHLHYHVQTSSLSGGVYTGISLTGLPGMNVTCPSSGNPGTANGPPLPNNSFTNCPDYFNQGFGGVTLFDHKDCRGNPLRLTTTGQYNIANIGWNDRVRSMYIQSGWSVKMTAHVPGEPLIVHCHNVDMWNLDTDYYDNSNIKIGWGSDPNGYNMISWVQAYDSPNCGGTMVGGYTYTGNDGGGGEGGSSDWVAIFDEVGCTGTQYGWSSPTNGWFDLTAANGPDYMNDKSTCIQVQTGKSVLVSEHFAGGGGQKCFTNTNSDLAHATYNNGVNINNSISSVDAFDNDNCNGFAAEGVSDGDTITVHENWNYSGTQYGWHDEGPFNLPDYMQMKATSIGVTPGWSLAVYRDLNQQGIFTCLTQSDVDLADNLLNNGESANDNFRSVYVHHNTNCAGLLDPPTMSMTAVIADPAAHEVEVQLTWNSAAPEWQMFYWGDGADHGMHGSSGSQTITHQYASGTYTLAFDVVGNDRQTYTVSDVIEIGSFACDGAVTLEGVVPFEFKDCAYVDYQDYVQLTEPGLYELLLFGLDNKVSSIHFPQDGSMSAMMYKGPAQTGQSLCRSWDMWDMSLDTWPDGSPMNDTVSSIEIFANDTCTPPPEMTLDIEVLNPHGEIRANVTWGGASEGWQIVYWGDGSDFGMQGSGGNQSPPHWYPGPGTYTVTLQVENAAPDWEIYTLAEEVIINDYACGDSVPFDEVVVFDFSDCAYRDAGDYELLGTTPGLYNLTGSDDGSSIHIPSGMSARLYEGPDGTGEAWCTGWDMWNMDLDTWPDGSPMDNTVSSIRIFTDASCGE